MISIKKVLFILFLPLLSFQLLFSQAAGRNSGKKKPKVALVLSGGGAKGLAEIPLLEALEEEGIQVDMVLGTSMGALLGSLYCAGYSPKEIRQFMTELDLVSIITEWPQPLPRVPAYSFSTHNDNYFSIPFSPTQLKLGSAPGFLGDQNILNLLSTYLSKVGDIEDFDKLSIPFRAVTVDVSTGKQVVYKNGSLVRAVRGSMSLPGVWVPALMSDGTYVMDGGLQNNLPVQLALDYGADIVIAMDVASSVYKNPEEIDDLVSVGIQIFNMIISTNAVAQHKLADLLLIPDLSEFSTMDFSRPQGIIEAGELCVKNNREAIHKIALELEKQGVSLVKKDYDRVSNYDLIKAKKIEKFVIKDIAFKEKVPLPSPERFKKFVGKELNEKTALNLTDTLADFRTRYHLASLSFEAKAGSDSEHCIIEITANHYSPQLSKLFFGGNPSAGFTNVDSSGQGIRFYVVPDFTVGAHLIGNVELLAHLYFGNTSGFDFSLMPYLAKWNDLSIRFDTGAGVSYGSLEPASNIIFKDRLTDDDIGLYFHGGLQFRFIDNITASTGIRYDYNYLHSLDDSVNIPYFYFDAVFNTFEDELIDFKGAKVDILVKSGGYGDGFPYFSSQVMYSHRFELIRNRTSLGIELNGANVHFPYKLNSGYADFGGFYGMCGYPQFTYKRDFAIAGITLNQKIFSPLGIPVHMIMQAKAGIKDNYSPYDSSYSPSDKWFEGVESMNDVIGGAALYFVIETPPGNIYFGGSFNSNFQYTVCIGLM
ncbi:patatin-like phospholipase family protein [Treponema sp.]|uniref:patatin-like phospholipase family protein n=1 Tax=Treponema sp. TaxID=166 RepID=UPI0025EA9D7D|nr:patatin-like phospholipase family protein [Treponema sp.]MCR5218329.1 patatin-like phospholipase family protein [Treponema sp.]